ncbi:ABC transporter G family member 22-like [Prosopis cineraria]|uniref:ABC transporter G family member 22-like n=1 Tax=Prosopis cineraria TaxID=364024 RepID=UPI00240F8F1E|nr:ABC transporter G family member 22-like [Prosopis cineraria]
MEKRELTLSSFDAPFVPHGKFGCRSSHISQTRENEDVPAHSFSFDKRVETSRGGTVIRKTKSLNAQFLINVDGLINNAAGSFHQMDSNVNGSSIKELRYSLSFTAPTSLSQELSDVLKLPGPKCEDGASDVSAEEGSESCQWTRMQMEPTLPIHLKFEDVKYNVPLRGEKSSGEGKYILHGITGSVRPGEILALMGPSGGGKTTLLNILSGRTRFNSGSITYNDRPYTKSLKKRIGYVTQDDVVFPHLTVKETLTYVALLRLSKDLSITQKKERVMNVLSELCLERCQDTAIGGNFIRGVSGGERKRVCIGTEILLNPSLLFLDEPTSGLDSTTASRIVQILQNISKEGKTVVTTIHQPSSKLFSMFDKLILLGKGSTLYFGKASDAMMYFSSIGCSPLIAMNPAEFLIDLANGNMKEKSVPSELEDKFHYGIKTLDLKNKTPSPVEVHEFLVKSYEIRLAKREKAMLLEPVTIKGDQSGMQGSPFLRDFGATWSQQFCILFMRGIRQRRHEYFSCLRVTQVISTAIIVGLLWWHSGASSSRSLHDQAGLLFFLSVFWGFYPLFSAIFMFPQERAMLVKERSIDMYKLSAYFLAKNTSDVPMELLMPLVFMVIVYFMVGLKLQFSAFFLTILTIFVSVLAAQGLGQTISAAFLDVKKATTLASIVVMTFMLTGGFFSQQVPRFMSWVRYVSFNYHTYRLLLKIQYGCVGSTSASGCSESTLVENSETKFGRELEVGAMIIMIITYRLIAYLFLWRMNIRTN